MPRKSRLSDDAFSFVSGDNKPEKESKADKASKSKDSTGRKRKTSTAKSSRTARKTSTASKKKSGSAKSTQKRSIFVKYIRQTGQVVALLEFSQKTEKGYSPWSGVPDDLQVGEFTLPAELADKPLIEIHQLCNIVTAGRSKRLTRKK